MMMPPACLFSGQSGQRPRKLRDKVNMGKILQNRRHNLFRMPGRVHGFPAKFLLWQRGRRLWRDQDGVITIYMAVSFVTLLGIIGLAFDTARVFSVKQRLQEAVDSAGLAAAQASSDNRQESADRYFEINYGRFLETDLSDLTLIENKRGQELFLTAEAIVPATFMRLFGFQNIPVRVETTIIRQLTELEVALVLDVSTSMERQNRIESLRQASHDFIDVLFGDQNHIPEIRVSIVPYAGTIKVGSAYKAWTKPQWENWRGCVHDRHSASKGDQPPSAGLFKTDFYHANHPFYQWESKKETDGRWTKINERTWSRPPNAGERLIGLVIITEDNPHPHPSEEERFCSSMEIKTLSSARQSLLQNLTNLTVTKKLGLSAPGTTGTRTDLGLLWGWRTLSPLWRSQWRYGERMKDYHSKGVTKAVVLMTDGANNANMSRTLRGQKSKVNRQMLETCSQMKQRDGVIIYVIALSVNETETKENLRKCASSASHYFDSISREELRNAFQTVANQLVGLNIQ